VTTGCFKSLSFFDFTLKKIKNVRWLTGVAMLDRVYALRQKIATLLEDGNINAAEVSDSK